MEKIEEKVKGIVNTLKELHKNYHDLREIDSKIKCL